MAENHELFVERIDDNRVVYRFNPGMIAACGCCSNNCCMQVEDLGRIAVSLAQGKQVIETSIERKG